MKTTGYFTNAVMLKRTYLTLEMCAAVVANPYRKEVQTDGRTRLWADIDGKWLRVVLLEDGETLHNAFFDRRFKP